MDKTTLTLAVDSTQVNSASAALQKMAGEGYKAESVVAKLANTAQLQGRALNSGIVKNAAAAADSIKGLTGATSALASAQDFSKTTSGLAAAAAQANAATGAVQAFGAAIAASAAAGVNLQIKAPTATRLEDAVQAPARPATLASLTNERLRPLMRQYKADGLPDTDAYEKALKQIDAEWKKHEEIAVAAQKSVATQATATAGAVAAVAAQVKNTTSEVNALNAAASKAPAPQTAVAAATTNTGSAGAGTAVGVNAKQITTAGDAASKSAKQLDDLGMSAKQMAMKHQIAAVQVKDFAEQVLAGGSPVRAFAMQGAAVVSNYGGFANTLKALSGLITPFRLAVGGAAAAVGALGYAYMEGAKQSKAFADAIVLSGNFAGQTEGQFNALAKAVAESGRVTVAGAREAAQALISTGEIGPQVIGKATEALALYSKATGKSADDVAAEFAKMSRSPSKFAEEVNRSMNLFTAAQLDAIKAMEEGGRATDAQSAVYDKLLERLKNLDPNLGTIERLLRSGKNAWANFWDAAYDIGRTETLEQKIANARDKIVSLQQQGQTPNAALPGAGKTSSFSVVRPGAGGNALQAATAKAQDEYRTLNAENFRKQDRENDRAIDARTQKEATEAGKVIDSYLKRGKAASEYKKKLDELNRSFETRAAAGVPVSKEDQAVARTELKKEFTPAKGAGSNEAAQVLREQLADDLSAFKAALNAEKETLAFHQREMQGLYQAGGVSLKSYFDDKRQSIADGVKAELAELDKEIARLEQYKAAIKDPSEKVKTQKQINQVGAEKIKLQTAADRDVKLTNQEEAASFKQLNDQIINYNANLLQMQGDEIGAAKLRAQVTIENARILAAQGAKDAAGNPVNVDVSALQQAIAVSNEFAEVQRRASDLAQNTARAEEAANLAAEVGGKSLLETENAVYAVRSKAVDQLGILATKARELADASTDPKIKQFAADLALQYAKAADAVDPALNRLREAQKDLASGITGSINNGIANFGQNYSAERKQARDETKTQKDEYQRRIDILEGYLATTADKNDKARLREKIANLQAQKDDVKGESKGSSFLKTINSSILQPMAGQAFATVNKLLVTDPLQKYLENQFKSLSEGDGMFAKFFKDSLGIKDPKTDANGAILAQAQAANASATALDVLTNAANSAAGALGNPTSKPLTVETGSAQAAPSMGDFTRADRALGDGFAASSDPAAAQAVADARNAVEGMGATSKDAASAVNVLAQAAGKGGGALGLLPSLMNMISAAATAFTASMAASSAGNSGSALASVFGKIGGSASAGSAGSDAITSYYFHTGGVVGGSARVGSVPSALFDGATRYHTGGIAGNTPDGARAAIASALKHGEVPAILMKNEEVLRRDDPRHRENLGTQVFQQIMKGEKPWAQAAAANNSTQNIISNAATSNNTVNHAASADSVSNMSASTLLQNIASSKRSEGGENSATVLQGLLSRLGVKDDEPAVSSALKVAGARELGGPVSAGKLYRVNEKRPELLNVAGKQYLMMGSQGGSVDPNPQQGGGKQLVVHNNFAISGQTSPASQAQIAAAAARGVQRGGRNL